MRKIWPLWKDRSGVAIVEFALILPVLALLTVGTIDFGLGFAAKLQLAGAVEEGAQYAFLTGSAVTAQQIQTVVQGATGLSPINVNANYSAASCACVLAGPPPALSAQNCASPCADGSTPGKYATITATYTYSPIFPSYGLVSNPVMSETATVRVQ